MGSLKWRMPNLTTQIFIGMGLGVVLGVLMGPVAIQFDILSHIFLRLIKMIIAPLVLTTLVVGIARLGDFSTVGRVGVKTIVYFQIVSLLALLTGLILVQLFQPGVVMPLDIPPLGTTTGIEAHGLQGLKSFSDQIIPSSIFKSLAENELLQIVFFSLFMGVGLAALGESGRSVLNAVEALSQVMFNVTRYVMAFAPWGAFGALAAVIGKFGVGILSGYAYLLATFLGGLLFFIFVVLAIICLIFRIPFLRLLQAVREPALLAFSAASSQVAYPKLLERLEKFGCSARITSFVLPLGYSFNLGGSMMYMTFATVFVAQVYDVQFSVYQNIILILILMVTSKGMAGVPRASLVVIAGMLSTFNIPVEGLALVIGVDQILDMGRSGTNVVGNAVATAVVSKLEGELRVS